MDDGKANNIISIDLKGKTGIADYMIIASGTSSRHASSLADKLIKLMKESYDYIPMSEGMEQGDWILVDVGDIIIHIFREEIRELYNLEKMWTIPSPDKLAIVQ